MFSHCHSPCQMYIVFNDLSSLFSLPQNRVVLLQCKTKCNEQAETEETVQSWVTLNEFGVPFRIYNFSLGSVMILEVSDGRRQTGSLFHFLKNFTSIVLKKRIQRGVLCIALSTHGFLLLFCCIPSKFECGKENGRRRER